MPDSKNGMRTPSTTTTFLILALAKVFFDLVWATLRQSSNKLVKIHEVRWLYVFKNRHSKKNYLIQCQVLFAIYQTTSIYIFSKRLRNWPAFTSFQIIFKVNTEIISNDDDIYAINKIVSFTQEFDNHTKSNQFDT